MIVGNILHLDTDQLRDNLRYDVRAFDPITAMEYMQFSQGQVDVEVYVEYGWTISTYDEPVWEIDSVELTFQVSGISHPNIYRLTSDEMTRRIDHDSETVCRMGQRQEMARQYEAMASVLSQVPSFDNHAPRRKQEYSNRKGGRR